MDGCVADQNRSKTRSSSTRGAAAEVPSAEAVREWARGRRAFISSVMSELPGERQAAADGVRAVGGTPVMFEQFGGRDADPEDAYLSEVETADIYLGILVRATESRCPHAFRRPTRNTCMPRRGDFGSQFGA